MSSLAFFDTNVVLYADDAGAGWKQARAIELFSRHQRAGMALVSIQVLQEYFWAATRKLKLDPKFAQRKVEVLSRSHVVRTEVEDVVVAIELHRLHQVSFWDALILQSARKAGAHTLYSEDLSHNSVLAGVRIVNPFLEDA